MAVTSTDVANQAIMLLGDNQPLVTGVAPNFDSSTTGVILSKIYGPCVATVGRQFAWDMARQVVTLATTGNTAPSPWTYEYGYPSNGIEVWELFPATITDANDPLPYNWVIGNAVVSSQQQRVIWTNLQNAKATYNNNPNENTWDAGFREAVVRLLASELALAAAGKPDISQGLLQSGASFEQIAESRQG